MENTQKIYCDVCGAYLFTEQDTKDGYKRTDDCKQYCYDEINDIFVCNNCLKNNQKTSIFYDNGKEICVGDTIELFGMIGVACFECGAYGIGFKDAIDWELIESKIYEVTGCDNRPYFCRNDNFVSFWELLENFNCEENCCTVVEQVI